MRRAVLAAAMFASAGCSEPASPPPSASPASATVRDIIERLNQMTEEGGHGPHHRADNTLQRELWKRLSELPAGAESDALLLAAAEGVYTRYDMNYFHGILWHWPYLCSRRAIDVCDRILKSTRHPETRERALWIKAFALRCPGVDPWEEAEKDLDTYAEQVRWKPDFDASREVYRGIARDFPDTSRGRAARRLVDQPDLSLVLPKGPRERDPRNPEN